MLASPFLYHCLPEWPRLLPDLLVLNTALLSVVCWPSRKALPTKCPLLSTHSEVRGEAGVGSPSHADGLLPSEDNTDSQRHAPGSLPPLPGPTDCEGTSCISQSVSSGDLGPKVSGARHVCYSMLLQEEVQTTDHWEPRDRWAGRDRNGSCHLFCCKPGSPS